MDDAANETSFWHIPFVKAVAGLMKTTYCEPVYLFYGDKNLGYFYYQEGVSY
jgi:hypothetical protein